ncbi:MAG TPA: SpvB/TcaC N-terminal domain-containing protein [Allosphingosinicella sp.]
MGARPPGVPELSLPKGGGALKGIGEKLSVNPATGTSSIAVPLPLPPGRGGTAPALSLTYGSGAGLGPFGMGWSFDVPRISRSTDRTLPRYGREGETDTFVLSGAEDLVPARSFDGTSWLPDVRQDGAYRVARFVPRQEGLFARIEQWRHITTGETFWTSITRDNISSRYGVTAASRIADPEDPSRVFAWLLCEVRDDRGDLVRYHYKAEDDAGVPASPFERNRRTGRATAQRYLKRLEYSVATPYRPEAGPVSPPAFHFEIVIDYGEHDAVAPSPAEARPWDYRADASSDFRPGFEVRTRRLARRILVFHRFTELGPDPVLTRSLDLAYDEDPAGARLTRAVQRGWAVGGVTETRPALSFSYSRVTPDPAVRTLDSESLENLPQGVDGARYRFVDLYEEAAPGVLVEEADAWFFKRNDGGRLEAAERVADKPNWARLGAGTGLVQLEADGRLYATVRAGLAGYAARADDGGWEPFRPFASNPAFDWSDPALRHADLDGDGRAEALLLGDETIRWYRNGGRRGYSAETRTFTGTDEESGPAGVLDKALEGIFLADMSGDGLADIVRVRNGEISYWPNLGYGKFGARVSMNDAPIFDRADLFDPARLRLGDIDGSGTTDLIYLGRHASLWWINQAGNRWSAARELALGLPTLDPLTQVELTDLMGIGTSCLVWSSSRPSDQARPLRFIDLMGGVKPYLLTGVDNGAGARSEIEYQASGAYYRADRRAGRPWRTKLPFPVQLVRRIVHHDLVSGGRLTSEYSYRHGYYDRAEREFRGFAMVEQRDVESVAEPAPHDLPPVLTRSWFHTGAYALGAVSNGLADEYFSGAIRLPDSRVEGAATPREQREAHRALRGRMLRQEIYALDGSALQDVPYLVTETRSQVRRLQPCGEGERDHGVFAAHPLETLSQHLERDSADPRVAHELILDVDRYGNPLRTLKAAYPRRAASLPSDPALSAVATAQGRILATVAEGGFAEDVAQPRRHRHSVPVWTAEFEVTGLTSQDEILAWSETRAQLGAMTGVLPFEQEGAAGPARRLLAASVNLYRSDATADADPNDVDILSAAALPLGTLDPLALPYRNYALALTDGLVAAALGGRPAAAGVALALEGYEQRSETLPGAGGAAIPVDGWWIGSPLESFAAAGFYQPVKSRDAFGAVWKIGYDPAWLTPAALTDPLGNHCAAVIDYRHLAPSEIADPNGNRRLAAYDAFGRPVAVAVAGKAGSADGDSLAAPTESFAYVETEWSGSGQPNYAHAKARESHGDPATRWLETRIYSDGFGRELATKTKVRPGRAHYVDGKGDLQSRHADPRWVGTGRNVYDNKGNVLRRYEPYFSVTEAHEEEDALRLWGVSPEMRYDPLGRLVETRFPDLTTARHVRGAWREESWDRNDTLASGAPWDKAATPNLAGGKDQRARALAEAHAGTPGIVHFDTLGRPLLAEEDNQGAATYKTRTILDILGMQREVWDANGNRALLQRFDLAGQLLYAHSNDAGESFALAGVDGQPRHRWTARGHYIRHDYDSLRRPTATQVTGPASAAMIADRIVYGEAAAGAAAANLLGRPWLVFDGAGAARTAGYDFKGNPLGHERFLIADPVAAADWSALPPEGQLDAWLGSLGGGLFEAPLAAATAFDALDRPVTETAPDGSETRYLYDEGGALRTVAVAGLAGRPSPVTVVADIGYDARGRRSWIEHGNGIVSFSTYDATGDRLRELLATTVIVRDADGDPAPAAAQPAPLQWLVYTHDPAGNIVEIEDLAQDFVFNEGIVQPRRLYEYDALYRLTAATGREHGGQTLGGAQHNAPAALAQALPADSDMQNLRPYTQHYEHDPVGNITRMRHVAPGGGWTRDYLYDYQRTGPGAFPASSHPGDSNRLYSTTLGSAPAQLYEHDAAGNILALPSVSAIAWNHDNQPETMHIGTLDAYYRYDGAGERVRKLVDKGHVKEERLYLGNYEIYRRWTGGTLDLRRDTLHVKDDERRVLLIETEKDTAGAIAAGQAPVLRYQLDDHIQSAWSEVDEVGKPISYEEYHPYGTSALHWKNGGISQKRYRFTGMERDEESGFCYHSARYYCAHLGRWCSADPAGLVDGPNLYQFAQSTPINARDPSGTFSQPGPPSINVGIKITAAGGTMHKKVGVMGSVFAALPGRYVSTEFGFNVSLNRFSKMYNNTTGGGSFRNVQIYGMVGYGNNSNLAGSKSTGTGISLYAPENTNNMGFAGIGYAWNINSFTGGMEELSNRTGGILLRASFAEYNIGFRMFNDVAIAPHFGAGTDYGITGTGAVTFSRGMRRNEVVGLTAEFEDITGIPDKTPGNRGCEEDPRFHKGNDEGVYRTIGLNKDLLFGKIGIKASYSGPIGSIEASLYRYGGKEGALFQDAIHNFKKLGFTALFPYNMDDSKTGFDLEYQMDPTTTEYFLLQTLFN